MGERLITLILLALAVYRVAHLVAVEDGPFDLAAHLRRRAETTWAPREADAGVYVDHWVTRGLHCPLCLSFWLALPAGLLAPALWAWPLWWLACAGLVLVMHKAVER